MMHVSEQAKREAYAAKAKAEVGALIAEGARLTGSGFPQILFAGRFDEDVAFHASEKGHALIAAAGALGYKPGNWAAYDCKRPKIAMSKVLQTLQPQALVLFDASGKDALASSFKEAAALSVGDVGAFLGIEVLYLGDFATALRDPAQKRLAWEYLQKLNK